MLKEKKRVRIIYYDHNVSEKNIFLYLYGEKMGSLCTLRDCVPTTSLNGAHARTQSLCFAPYRFISFRRPSSDSRWIGGRFRGVTMDMLPNHGAYVCTGRRFLDNPATRNRIYSILYSVCGVCSTYSHRHRLCVRSANVYIGR